MFCAQGGGTEPGIPTLTIQSIALSRGMTWLSRELKNARTPSMQRSWGSQGRGRGASACFSHVFLRLCHPKCGRQQHMAVSQRKSKEGKKTPVALGILFKSTGAVVPTAVANSCCFSKIEFFPSSSEECISSVSRSRETPQTAVSVLEGHVLGVDTH